MSDNSNLGYGNITPNSNVGYFANSSNTHNPMFFGSNEGAVFGHKMINPVTDAAAANGCLSGYCNINNMKGGKKRKNIKNYIKRIYRNISRKMRKYSRSHKRKMSHRRRKTYRKKRTMSMMRRNRNRSRSRSYKGGTGQWQNNIPNTPSFSVANVNLPAKMSALASPPPIQQLCIGGEGGCVDNYNYVKNSGFAM